MNKILLELTPREAEMILECFANSKGRLSDGQIGFTEQQRRDVVQESVVLKIDTAFKPENDTLITAKDLFRIKDLATREYLKIHAGMQLSGKEIDKDDFVHYSLVNATIGWLNSKELLKKTVRFDNTDDSDDYLGTEY